MFLPDCFYTSGDGKRDGIYDPAQGKRVYADGVKSNMKYGRKTCILPVLYCMIKNTKHVKNMCHRGMKNGDQKCYDFTEDRSGRLIYQRKCSRTECVVYLRGTGATGKK